MTGKHYLGVDIGGTKCHALIADEHGQVNGFGETGPGSHEVVGYEGLRTALQAIVYQALETAGIKIQEIAAAGFGVAGYDWPDELQTTLEAISVLELACPIEVVNDTVIGLVAGASQGWGVGVVAGTGSNCWGWDRQHRIGRVTGCGSLFNEFGGGWDLVYKAIQSIGMEWTRRGPSTQLTQAFIKKVGAKDIEDFLEGMVMERYHLEASAARLVFEIAAQGDPVAEECIRWNGRELGSQAIGVIHQLGFEDLEFEVVLIGSLYHGSPLLLEAMQETIHAVAPRARFVRLDSPPVVGGVLLAMDIGGLDATTRRDRLVNEARERIEDSEKGMIH